MKTLFAFVKKEWMDLVRSGRLMILAILFVLLGILSPAIAKLTPWMMESMGSAMADTGLVIGAVRVDAMTSWTQFFKNIPIGLIAFVLIQSSIFTKEYQSGTLVLVLTKGLDRFKVVLAKCGVVTLLWTVGYWLCFGITWFYTGYYWDNSIVRNLGAAVLNWWLFGLWVVEAMVLFSTICRNNTGVLMGAGGVVVVSYMLSMVAKVAPYLPTKLMDGNSLMTGAATPADYREAVVIVAVMTVAFVVASIPVMNKRRI